MPYLKAQMPLHKLRRIIRILYGYWKAYTHFQGWQSWTWYEGGAQVLAGFASRARHRKLFCADPFLFRHSGANYLFYETVDAYEKGKLGCLKEVDGKWIDQGIVLEEPWHLSYPQVFEEGGKVYMLPEACDFGKGGVHLYEAVEFPMKWKRVATLIDRPFADSTILKYDGHWYMACYTIPPKETAELWHADSLFGPWTRHPQWRNINQSNRLRRCGGSFIRRGDVLYRVAQDCNGPLYGKRLFKVRVEKISPTEYKEGEATILHDRTMPPFGYCHTYNEMEVNGRRLSVVDVHHNVWESPSRVAVRIVRAFKRKIGC